MIVVDKIKGWLEQDKSVKRVAEDLQLTSELVLLVRMIFADGELRPEELKDFKWPGLLAVEGQAGSRMAVLTGVQYLSNGYRVPTQEEWQASFSLWTQTER